jgi:hypothetical protein
MEDFLCPSQIKKFETQGSCLQELQSITEENEEERPLQTPRKKKHLASQVSLSKVHSRLNSAKKLTDSHFLAEMSLKKKKKSKNQMDVGYNFFVGVKSEDLQFGKLVEGESTRNALGEYRKFHHDNDSNRNCGYKFGLGDPSPVIQKPNQEDSQMVCISSRSDSKKNFVSFDEGRGKILEFKNENAFYKKSLNYSLPYKEMIEGVQCDGSETGIKGNKHYFNKIDITENIEENNQTANLLSKNFCFVCNTRNKHKKQKKHMIKKTPILIGELTKVLSKMKSTFD